MELPVRPFFERQTPAKSLKGYLRKLMNNPRVSRYLEKHHEGIVRRMSSSWLERSERSVIRPVFGVAV